MKNKKSVEAMPMIIIAFVLAALMFIIIAAIQTDLLRGGGKETDRLQLSTRDFDGDGIADAFDDCPCDAGKRENRGCNPPPTIPTTKEECDQMRGLV